MHGYILIKLWTNEIRILHNFTHEKILFDFFQPLKSIKAILSS